MLKTVEAYLDSNAETVNLVPELAEHFDELKSICSRISLKDEEKRTVVLGKSLKKDKERNDAVSKALAVNGALYAYALKTGNIELEQKSNTPVSFIQRLRDTKFLNVLNSIKELANQYRSELVPNGITEDKFNSFSSKNDSFAAALGQREISVAIKTTVTQTIE